MDYSCPWPLLIGALNWLLIICVKFYSWSKLAFWTCCSPQIECPISFFLQQDTSFDLSLSLVAKWNSGKKPWALKAVKTWVYVSFLPFCYQYYIGYKLINFSESKFPYMWSGNMRHTSNLFVRINYNNEPDVIGSYLFICSYLFVCI